jgi:hypothetical protein
MLPLQLMKKMISKRELKKINQELSQPTLMLETEQLEH